MRCYDVPANLHTVSHPASVLQSTAVLNGMVTPSALRSFAGHQRACVPCAAGRTGPISSKRL
jgi:hypothetical protein